MAQIQIYDSRYPQDSHFALSSSWTANGSKIVGGPYSASITLEFSQSSLPAGASNIRCWFVAYVAKKQGPSTGIKSLLVNGSQEYDTDAEIQDLRLYPIDADKVTAVTISFKANGRVSSSGSGSLTFDDAHLLVEYTDPIPEVKYSSTRVEAGDSLTCTFNGLAGFQYEQIANYPNRETVSESITPNTSGTCDIKLKIPESWLRFFPNSNTGQAVVMLRIKDMTGLVVHETESTVLTVTSSKALPKNIVPTVALKNMHRGKQIRNHSYIEISFNTSDALYGATLAQLAVAYNDTTIYWSKDVSGLTSETFRADIPDISGVYKLSIIITDTRGNSYDCWSMDDVSTVPYNPVIIVSTKQWRKVIEGNDNHTVCCSVRFNYDALSQVSSAPSQTVCLNSGVQDVEFDPFTYYTVDPLTKDYVFDVEIPNVQATNLNYQVTMIVSDGITQSSVTRQIGTENVFARLDPANNAIGLGCHPSRTNCLELDYSWDILLGQENVASRLSQRSLFAGNGGNSSSTGNSNIVVSATQPSNPTAGMIWIDIS